MLLNSSLCTAALHVAPNYVLQPTHSNLQGTGALITLPEGHFQAHDVLRGLEAEHDLALAAVGYEFLGTRPSGLVVVTVAVVGQSGQAPIFPAATGIPGALVVGGGGNGNSCLGCGLNVAAVAGCCDNKPIETNKLATYRPIYVDGTVSTGRNTSQYYSQTCKWSPSRLLPDGEGMLRPAHVNRFL